MCGGESQVVTAMHPPSESPQFLEIKLRQKVQELIAVVPRHSDRQTAFAHTLTDCMYWLLLIMSYSVVSLIVTYNMSLLLFNGRREELH